MPAGPDSSAVPFLIGEPNVRLVSVITTGDTPPGDDGIWGGIPDGIGAYDNGNGTITVLVNHELSSGSGAVRDHGGIGAYIDRIVINKETLAVVSSDDLIKTVQLWDDATDTYVSGVNSAFNRFCSGDLAAPSAFQFGGVGTSARIYLAGEEGGTSRATATLVSGTGQGTLFELPLFGNMSFENIVANPYAQAKTIVAATDDSGEGQIYIYVGNKQAMGSGVDAELDKAGLTNGLLYGIKVLNAPVNETSGAAIGGRFTLAQVGDAVNGARDLDIAGLEAASDNAGVTGFLRPEDFAWDPDHPNVAYFVTTNAFSANPATTPTRLYKITFDDITNPLAGGTIEAVIDGTEGYDAHMFDNITVGHGKIIIQEDPGNQGYVAKVWEYDIATDTLSQVANFDPAKFVINGTGYIGTQDEESSGVLDVTALLGDSDTRAYLLDAQVHRGLGSADPAANTAAVEMGQLMVMYVDDPFLIGGNGDDNLYGSGASEILRGNAGNDRASAGSGDDQLFGGRGNDILIGGNGNDQVNGDAGDDTLVGGANDDVLTGGTGSDSFIFDNRGETGADRITDLSGNDRVLTTVQLATNGNGIVSAGADGNFDLFGSSDVAIGNGGHAIDQLRYQGAVIIDGMTYYSYGLSGGNGGNGGGNSHGVALADFKLGAAELHLHDYLF